MDEEGLLRTITSSICKMSILGQLRLWKMVEHSMKGMMTEFLLVANVDGSPTFFWAVYKFIHQASTTHFAC